MPTPSVIPVIGRRADQVGEIKAKISHYWPPLGGVNCSRFIAGECVAKMASGLRWQDWINKACACPIEYPFGTRFKLANGSIWECQDRGGAIVTAGGVPWLDLLQQKASYSFGSIQNVEVLK